MCYGVLIWTTYSSGGPKAFAPVHTWYVWILMHSLQKFSEEQFCGTKGFICYSLSITFYLAFNQFYLFFFLTLSLLSLHAGNVIEIHPFEDIFLHFIGYTVDIFSGVSPLKCSLSLPYFLVLLLLFRSEVLF